ncbi:MAG: cupin domain-containing protein [Nitrospinota bacterium]
MKVVNSSEVKGHTAPGGRVSRILLDHEMGLGEAAVVQVDFAQGTASEFHTREGQVEVLYSLRGKNAVAFPDGSRLPLPEGSATFIPAGVEHRHENDGTPMATLLVVFVPPKGITDGIRKRPLEA